MKNNKLQRRARVSRSVTNSSANIGPPQILANPFKTHILRFYTSSATSAGITPKFLAGAAGVIGTVNNSSAVSWTRYIRIKRVRIWAASAPSTGVSAVSILWNAGFSFTPNALVSDSSVSPAFPAHLSVNPPKKSLAGDWLDCTSTTTVFTPTCPANSVMDIEFDAMLPSATSDVVTISGISSIGVGIVAYLAADGTASNNWKPVALPTTS